MPGSSHVDRVDVSARMEHDKRHVTQRPWLIQDSYDEHLARIGDSGVEGVGSLVRVSWRDFLLPFAPPLPGRWPNSARRARPWSGFRNASAFSRSASLEAPASAV